MTEACPFCEIANGAGPFVHEWPDTVAIVPLNPVTAGHLLVIPKAHVADALANAAITAATMARASDLAEHPCNLITSVGEVATQSVFHLHVHIVPRRVGDGLKLPWTTQQRSKDVSLNNAALHAVEALTGRRAEPYDIACLTGSLCADGYEIRRAVDAR